MPQTYMRTSLPRNGLNSAFLPVSELCISSMRFQPATRRLRRHELQNGSELRTVGPAGERHPQRHEQLRAALAGLPLEEGGERVQIRARALQCRRRGREESGPRGGDDTLLLGAE